MKYIAYGSNLNLSQMARRCPTARAVGSALLEGWQLTFRGVATIIPQEGAATPVAVWEIDEACERALDRYEGYPYLYGKEVVEVFCRGEIIAGMTYTMNGCLPSLPSQGYYDCIKEGYQDVGLDESKLEEALEHTQKLIKK